MSDPDLRAEVTPFGFKYGAAEVSRLFSSKGAVVLEVVAGVNRVGIYVSATGRSVQVYRRKARR